MTVATILSLGSMATGYGHTVPDAIFAHPRLAPVYDAFDGPRDDQVRLELSSESGEASYY